MSNAMRFGKRSLAGVAAGALAAGTLALAATAPASAAAVTAASIAFQWPSATVVGGNFNDDTVLFPIIAFDAGGVPITGADTIGANQRVDVVVTKPSFVTDDSIGFGFNNTAQASIAKNITTGGAASAAALGFAGIGLIGPTGAAKSWNNALALSRQGTYSITATLVNTASGAAISTTTATLQFVAPSGAPAANVSYISGQAYAIQGKANTIGALGTTALTTQPLTSNAKPNSFAVMLTDANGGPYVTNDDSLYITNGSFIADDSLAGGWATAETAPMVYTLNNNSGFTWGTAGTANITTNVYSTAIASANIVGTGNLPVAIAGATTSTVTTAPDVLLANTLSYYVEDDVYEVPTGTTALDFTVLTSNRLDDTTIQWDAWSASTGGVITPSGGRAALSSDAGAISVTVNAAADDADDTMQIVVGPNDTQDTVVVKWANSRATISTSPGIAKVASATTIPGSITDQFGRTLPGTWTVTLRATNSASAAAIATATANASGEFTIEVPASAAPTTAQTKTFYVFAGNGLDSTQGTESNVVYTATGGVTSLVLSTPAAYSGVTATTRPLIRVPANGTAILQQGTAVASPTTVYDDTIVNAAGQALQLQASVSPNAVVTFSGSDGVLFSDRATGSVFYGNAAKTYTTTSPAATASIWALSTKPGLQTVTVTAGTSTATYTFYAAVASNAGRTLAVDPTKMSIGKNEFKSIEVTVTDIFGNAVPRNSGIAATLAGGGTLSSGSLTTNAAGKATVFYTAPIGDGIARVDFLGSSAMWQVGDIAGAPAAVRAGTTEITVGGSSSVKTILIVGERTTVGGKPGIRVEGETTGFDVGSKMVPSIRFPGQSEYTAGTARPTTSVAGDFSWQRKTGKKTYVFFTNEAGDVRSNRVIIPAN